LGIAKEIDLNNEEFRNCFKGQESKGLILEDLAEAQKLNLPGVPFLFINNHEMLGEYNKEDVEFYIDQELKK
jgi:predicted DsbA family dithiol-disulfide isomerase